MRDTVIFPRQSLPFFIGRPRTFLAIEQAIESDRRLLAVAQKFDRDEPLVDEMFEVGVIAKIQQVIKFPNNNTVKVILNAIDRVRIVKFSLEEDYYRAQSVPFHTELPCSKEDRARILGLMENVLTTLRANINRTPKTLEAITSENFKKVDPVVFCDLISPFLQGEVKVKQDILEEPAIDKRLGAVYDSLLAFQEKLRLEKSVKEKIQGRIGKSHKEFLLNEQMRAIQKELGKDREDFVKLKEKIDSLDMTEEAREVCLRELKKLKQMSSMSSEANVVSTYLEWLTSMPWSRRTEDNFDLDNAERILEEDHFGLEKVKERILEHIAVSRQVGKIKGPILCLAGPPGVGKTSLAKSVARALNRRFVRMSLGGVRDEAEIRGHRRTYVGALPGKIMQMMRKAKSANPVFLLDEIDKMSSSHMGDPASALLEALDPEQNDTFTDHYFEVEYDLSDVLFFCTANNRQSIPAPLLDRMEVIPLSGYTETEKKMIAKKYLIPKQFAENGVERGKLKISEPSLSDMIRLHTKEAGVRNLERLLAKICRKALRELYGSEPADSIHVKKKLLAKYLGTPPFNLGSAEKEDAVGIATGLAWTPYGGDLLQIEVAEMKGKGEIHLTGTLGDVMKESAQAALSHVRHYANQLGIHSNVFGQYDVHFHVPEGATPKDGPSAGITLACALVSALTKIPVRRNVAMTGEITLRGRVLPIGGLKEKLLAAKRAGVGTVLIPHDNGKDLEEIPSEAASKLEIHRVKTFADVISRALLTYPSPVDDDELSANDEKSTGPSIGTTDEKLVPPSPSVRN